MFDDLVNNMSKDTVSDDEDNVGPLKENADEIVNNYKWCFLV